MVVTNRGRPLVTAPTTIELQLLERLATTEQAAERLTGDTFVVVTLGYRGLAIFYPRAKPITGFERADLDHLQALGLVRITQQRSGAVLCQITREGYALVDRLHAAAPSEGGGSPLSRDR